MLIRGKLFLKCLFKAAFLSLIGLTVPLGVWAQESSHAYDYWTSQTGAVDPESIKQWRQKSEAVKQKIDDLGDQTSLFLSVPVSGVDAKDLHPNFGNPRLIGRTHEGEDIFANEGAVVISPTQAVVIHTGVGPREGTYVVTANPGDETFVYMHLKNFGPNIAEGLVLTEGSVVGYVGNTGNAADGPPMLHFEIRDQHGTPTDPYPRLVGRLTLLEKMSRLSSLFGQSVDNYTPLVPAARTTILSRACILLLGHSDFSNLLCGS